MPPESWLKISLPAFPVAFTIFGVWLYWGDNPLSLLAPSIAFWGLVILFYLFSHIEMRNRSYPLILMIGATTLWLISSITSHSLGKFVTSSQYGGFVSIFSNKNFWYAYICCAVACGTGLGHFVRFEPLIVAQIERDRRRIDAEGE
jgi:Na+/citrate or Na+/malate symporter